MTAAARAADRGTRVIEAPQAFVSRPSTPQRRGVLEKLSRHEPFDLPQTELLVRSAIGFHERVENRRSAPARSRRLFPGLRELDDFSVRDIVEMNTLPPNRPPRGASRKNLAILAPDDQAGRLKLAVM
jgi:hypothetical protein